MCRPQSAACLVWTGHSAGASHPRTAPSSSRMSSSSCAAPTQQASPPAARRNRCLGSGVLRMVATSCHRQTCDFCFTDLDESQLFADASSSFIEQVVDEFPGAERASSGLYTCLNTCQHTCRHMSALMSAFLSAHMSTYISAYMSACIYNSCNRRNDQNAMATHGTWPDSLSIVDACSG